MYQLFKELVNTQLTDHIKTDLNLSILQTSNAVEIGQPDLYETFLYKIEVINNEIHVNKSEHYVDDINSLALEGIIDKIIVDYIGVDNVETILQP